MASIDTTVDIDIADYLDEVSFDELVYELKHRKLSDKQLNKLQRELSINIETSKTTIIDNIKLELILDNYGKKSIEELTNFFNY